MSIYTYDGREIITPYSKDGRTLRNCFDIHGNKIYPDAFHIKVMTYNVGGWYIGSGTNVPTDQKAFFYELQTEMIENNDPDVLIIQEYLANFSADGTSALTMLQEFFPYVHTKVSGTYFGRAICSKYPITNYVERTFTQEPQRYFDSCIITIGNNSIPFVNTHLGLTQENRTPEIQQLITFLNTLYSAVIGGDFNTGITVAGTESQNYIDNVKPFVDAGYNTANFQNVENGFKVTCIDGSYRGMLDNIYASSNISISDVYVDTTKESEIATIGSKLDHMPLIATLQIGGTT